MLSSFFKDQASTHKGLHGLEGFTDLPRLKDLLPYEAYDERTGLFYNKGTTGFVLQGAPLVGCSLSSQSQLADLFSQESFLKEGVALQFLLVASPRVGPFLESWAEAQQEGFYRDLARQRANFFKKDILTPIGSSNAVLRDYQLLISYTMPGHITDPVSVERIKRSRESFQECLRSIQVPTQVCDAQGLIQSLSDLLSVTHQERPEPVQWSPQTPIAHQITSPDHDYTVSESHVGVDQNNFCFKSYVPRKIPDLWALSHMGRFIGDMMMAGSSIPCPFFLHYGFFMMPGQGREKTRCQSRRETLENSIKGRMSKWIPNLHAQHQELNDCLEEVGKGSRFIQQTLSTTLIAKREEVERCEQRLKHVWQAAGWDLREARHLHLPMLIASLPMTWTLGETRSLMARQPYGYGQDLVKMGLARQSITKEAQNMVPLIGEWKGQRAKGLLMTGRTGQLSCWSPFAEALDPVLRPYQNHNYNCCIAGVPGSGKSVLLQEIMRTILGHGGRVFVLDNGFSFEKFAKILKGQHLTFRMSEPLSLNPFSSIPTAASEDATRQNLLGQLLSVLRVMAAPRDGTSDLQKSYLNRAIQDAWEREGPQSSIETVVSCLRDHEERGCHDLADMLYAFTARGTYGKFFKGPAQVNLDEDVVVVECSELESHPDLAAVVVQMVIIQICQIVLKSDRRRVFAIIIDEAWKLLQGKDTASFIEGLNRTLRKYYGSVILASQNLTDFFKEESPAVTNAFMNSYSKVIMEQNQEDITYFKSHDFLKEFVSTPYKEELLRSIKPNNPHYSEMAVFSQDLGGVPLRLRLDPFSRLLYTTNPAEVAALNRYRQEGLSLFESIEAHLKATGEGQ